MIGLVLAAGQGQRLRPDTDALPKTLLTVDGELTILDTILANLAKSDLSRRRDRRRLRRRRDRDAACPTCRLATA